jgi:hypothetical protein
VLKRFVLLLTVAAVMLAMSALPTLARTAEVVTTTETVTDSGNSGTANSGTANSGSNGAFFSVNEGTEVIQFPGGTIRY